MIEIYPYLGNMVVAAINFCISHWFTGLASCRSFTIQKIPTRHSSTTKLQCNHVGNISPNRSSEGWMQFLPHLVKMKINCPDEEHFRPLTFPKVKYNPPGLIIRYNCSNYRCRTLMAECFHYLLDSSPAKRTVGQVRRACYTTAHMTAPENHNHGVIFSISFLNYQATTKFW